MGFIWPSMVNEKPTGLFQKAQLVDDCFGQKQGLGDHEPVRSCDPVLDQPFFWGFNQVMDDLQHGWAPCSDGLPGK